MFQNVSRRVPAAVILLTCVTGASTTDVSAQSPEQVRDPLSLSFSARFMHQMETDFNREGDFELFEYGFGVSGKGDLTRNLSLRVSAGYTLSEYDFGTPNVFAGDSNPWEDVHQLDVGAVFEFQLEKDWTIFGGPVMSFSNEDGSDLDDGFSGGAFVGATYQVNENLTIGGGVGAVSQIEDNARFFPVAIIDWKINDDWRLATGRSSQSFVSGPELIYSFADNWEAAVGGGFRYRRFRLDDEGVAPGGVGQDESYPVWLRASYNFNENLSLTVQGGGALGGEMELENDTGRSLTKEDYDPAFFIGVSGRIRF